MKAIVLKKYGKSAEAFELRNDVQVPAFGENEVQVEVEAFGLNFADVMARKGLYGDAPALPAVLGYEVVGKVVAQGSRVHGNLMGKRVVAFTRFGGYGKIAVTNHQACIPVEENDDAAILLALATQYCTAYYASHVATTVVENDVVLQHAAAGGVGTALVQLCKLQGAKVVGLTGSDSKFTAMLQNGCDEVINYTKTEYEQEVKKRVGKIDVSFNSVAGSTFKKDLRLLNKGGRLVCYGAAERLKGRFGFFSTLGMVLRMGRIVPVKLLMQSQSLVGVNMLRIADHRPDVLQHCMLKVMELYRKGQIKPLVGAVYPVERLAEAHDFFESGLSSGKLVIQWN